LSIGLRSDLKKLSDAELAKRLEDAWRAFAALSSKGAERFLRSDPQTDMSITLCEICDIVEAECRMAQRKGKGIEPHS
jgi:hypothetical protein